ncbi:MAG: hypothetical protein ACKVH8_01350 [Pirellulales bacterium]
MLQQIATYSLLFTYMAISLFGQTMHALSGCEHAHLNFSHTHASEDQHSHSDHHSHGDEHGHNNHSHEQHTTAATDGLSLVHTHQVLESHDCVLCQYLSQSQTIASGHSVIQSSIAAQSVVYAPEAIYLSSPFTVSSPRAPPLV